MQLCLEWENVGQDHQEEENLVKKHQEEEKFVQQHQEGDWRACTAAPRKEAGPIVSGKNCFCASEPEGEAYSVEKYWWSSETSAQGEINVLVS